MSNKSALSPPYEGVSKSAGDFARLGMKIGNVPEPWEDGMRVDPARKNCEWWYFGDLIGTD